MSPLLHRGPWHHLVWQEYCLYFMVLRKYILFVWNSYGDMVKCAEIFSQILLLAKERYKRETNNNDNGIKFISDGFECQLC